MQTPDSNNPICQKILEDFIDGKVDDKAGKHLQNCDHCQLMVKNITAMSACPSVYPENENLNLKKQVLNRLAPLIKPEKIATKASSSFLPWFIGASLAGAFALLLFVGNQPVPVAPDIAIRAPMVSSTGTDNSFTISVNSQKSVSASMDSPVSLFNNETAIIKLADSSEILLEGPARLTVKPRGFHLLAGKATATVVPGKNPFIGTTIHGKIQVLGTIFSCETSAANTTVAVKRGSVKVIANDGTEKVLTAGQTTRILPDSNLASKSESIPPISQE